MVSSNSMPDAPEIKKKKHGCLWALLWFFIIVVVIILLVLGGLWSLKNGLISRRHLMNTLGQGKGEVTMLNLSDNVLNVDLKRVDLPKDKQEFDSTLEIKPDERKGLASLERGRYELTFASGSASKPAGTCTITINSGDAYEFIRATKGIIVIRTGAKQSSFEDLNITTSSLCRP